MNVSTETLKALRASKNQPGLQFYIAYAHTADITKHLGSFLGDKGRQSNETDLKQKDTASFHVAASSVLASIELVMELLYKVDLDRRPGIDKDGLFSTIQNVVSQSLLLLDGIQQDSADNRRDFRYDITKTEDEKKDVACTNNSTTSMFFVLLSALNIDKNVLSHDAKQVLRSVVQELLRRPSLCSPSSEISSTIAALANNLDLTWMPNLFSETACTRHDDLSVQRSQSTRGTASDESMSYEKLARTIPDLVVSKHVHGPEDFLFKVPHIIIEHWFYFIENIVIQNEVYCKGKSSKLLVWGSDALKLCTRLLELLQYMQLADFHPLRVALHGSSGFFSRAFFRIRHWIKNEFQSACKKLDTLSIHIAPESNANGHQYLCRLELFENSFRSFSFGHYLIAQRTLGSSSIGSAGKSFEHMQSGFVKPFSQEYNAMKFLLHEYTSMKYDSMVGKGVLNIVDYAKNNSDVDDESTVVSTLSHHSFCPASDEVLQKLAWSFQDREVEKFAELFGTDDCFIEHPQNTLPYRNRDIRTYFHNIMKRHTKISMFSIKKSDDGVNMGDSGLSQASGVLTARLVGELFDGSEVDYILRGECLMDAESKQIASLVLNGSPDIQCLKKNGDQRKYSWNGEELTQHCISNEGMGVSYCRPLSPAEKMAYEMNSVPGKAKSDGLTIVARSVIDGPLPTEMSIQEALKFVKNTHPLLNSHIQILEGELVFISTLKDCRRSIPLEILIDDTIDCEALMDTKFDCLEGDFLRVIISMNSGDHKQKEAEGDEPSSKETFFELVTVIYHGICDAISVRELHHQIIMEIAAVMNEPSRNIISDVLKIGPTPLPITAELLVKKALDERQAKTDFQVDGKLSTTPSPPRQPLEQAPLSWSKDCTPDDAVRCSRAIKRKFSAKKTRKMLDACKKNGTTMHGLISAAALIATSECGKAAKRVLCSAVDLRRRVQLKKSELVYAVGGFDGSAAFEYDIDADIDIWELARQVRSDIIDSVDSGRLFTTYLESIEGLLSAYKAGYLEGGTFGTIFLSNIGNENYKKSAGPMRWREFEYIYGQFLPGGPHYHITSNTFDGCLFLNCLYVNEVIPEDTAQAFFNTVYLLCCHV